eukprot:gnl/TRDRNA2_/TRDRNA2_86767_c0_seq1.p1 gnl/TRDRNA2_/TRDRNA2_86767_c0~~gnl/TRDRNA2_/TRDRNA2_86767_c0_seq1.p1  ORF type:complete len:268 (-),score=81.60 gnl/TRDRNA2_/TRDRNA2_86767_c0_seq1:221-1024(-)
MGAVQPKCCKVQEIRSADKKAEADGNMERVTDMSDSLQPLHVHEGERDASSKQDEQEAQEPAEKQGEEEGETGEEAEAEAEPIGAEADEEGSDKPIEVEQTSAKQEQEEVAKQKAEETGERTNVLTAEDASAAAKAKGAPKAKVAPKRKAASKPKPTTTKKSADAAEAETGMATVWMPSSRTKVVNYYTVEEVARHNTEKSLWLIMNRKVYDVTKFHKHHPGGAAVILNMAGKDATSAANTAHSNALPGNVMKEFVIGNVKRAQKVE